MDFPEIKPGSVIGARVYASRFEMIKNLRIPQRGDIAEIGVAHGELTEFLISELNPKRFYALDMFEMEKYPVHWGIPQEILLQGKTHYDFYRDRFASLGERLIMMRGLSAETAHRLPDASLDMIYIDAGHDYENVARDGAISAQKIKRDGILIFNDYVLYDPFNQVEYGVVPAVNEMLATEQWLVLGLALQKHMFCDIAISRI